jgi:hypothetical protein
MYVAADAGAGSRAAAPTTAATAAARSSVLGDARG